MKPLRKSLSPLGDGRLPYTSDWWLSGGVSSANCLAAYSPKGAASLAASYINLNNPGTYNAFPGIAPSWTSGNGWVGNGSGWLRTGIIPSSGWSAIIRVADHPFASGPYWPFGSYATGARFHLLPAYADQVIYGNGGEKTVATGVYTGTIGIAGNTAYRNGVAESGAIPAWTGVADEIYLLALNYAGGPSFHYNFGKVLAVAIYNVTLSPSQMAAINSACMAL